MSNTTTELSAIDYGRVLIDIGTALMTGRLQFVNGAPLPALFERDERQGPDERAHISHDSGAIGVIDGPHARIARENTRGSWTPRKGYYPGARTQGKTPDVAGVTPAGFKLLQCVQRQPGLSAQQIADNIGLSRKTVENLLSLLKQRHLIEARELKKG